MIKVYTAVSGNRDLPRSDIETYEAYNEFKRPVLNAKIYKVLPHMFFRGSSIWTDANLYLRQEPEVFLDLLNKYGRDIGVFTHPCRNCLYEEAETCKFLKLDSSATIDEQTTYYRSQGWLENAGLGAAYLIVRRDTEYVRQLCERWWAHICRYSVRDQISLPFVFRDEIAYFEEPKELYFGMKPHGT